MTFLLRGTIRDHLRRSRPEKILNVFQRIHLRFFRACGLASGRTSFASSRTAMSDRLLGGERHVDHVRLMGMGSPAHADAQMTRRARLSSRRVRVTWRYWPSIDRRDGCQSARRRRSHESGSTPTGSVHPGPTLPPPQ